MLTTHTTIDLGDLPESVRTGPVGAASQIVIPIGVPLEEVERLVINETLRHTKGDKQLAARLLGIAARTIYRKLAGEPPTSEPSDTANA